MPAFYAENAHHQSIPSDATCYVPRTTTMVRSFITAVPMIRGTSTQGCRRQRSRPPKSLRRMNLENRSALSLTRGGASATFAMPMRQYAFLFVLGVVMHKGLVSIECVTQDEVRIRASASARSFPDDALFLGWRNGWRNCRLTLDTRQKRFLYHQLRQAKCS